MGSGADSPCQGEMAQRARGGREGEYGRVSARLSRPRRRFAYFAAVGKVGRRPQTAKHPLAAAAAKSPSKKRKQPLRESGSTNMIRRPVWIDSHRRKE